VPAGYTATVLYALGDPLTATACLPTRMTAPTPTTNNRAGDHHDGMEWFGLSATARLDDTPPSAACSGMNHEATTDEKLSSFFLHANGGTSTLPRPAAEVDKETAIHGVSVVEMAKDATLASGPTCLARPSTSASPR
jgi:secreted PhoX family phosphatase